jgi:Zn-dependent peptidase ImmA (M78 family)
MAAATKGARAKAEVWQLWVRELVLYLSEYVELPKVTFPLFDDLPQDPNRLGMERVESLAGEARQVWRLGDGPIPNLTYVAEANGAIIVRHVLDADTLDALSLWMVPEQIPLVVLNADKRVAVRSRLDLAHELGHMILHRHLPEEYLRRSELFRLVEDQAFRFGAALLLPAHSFLEDLYSVSLDGLRALKSKWKVSIAMMIERLKHLEIISDEQHRRLRINYSTRQWNREEPLDREIEVEQPTFLIGAFRLLVDERIQTPDQISVNSGFSSGWVQRLLNVSLGTVSPNPPALKVVELKKQA